jgi:hypothetical protein
MRTVKLMLERSWLAYKKDKRLPMQPFDFDTTEFTAW